MSTDAPSAASSAGAPGEARRRSVAELVSLYEAGAQNAAQLVKPRASQPPRADVSTHSLLKVPDVTVYHLHREVGAAAGAARRIGDGETSTSAGAGSGGGDGEGSEVHRRVAASGTLRCLTVADPDTAGSGGGEGGCGGTLTFLMVGTAFAFPLVRAPALRASERNFVLMTADSSVTWGLTVGPGATDEEAAEFEMLLATHCRLFDMHTHDLLEVAEIDEEGNVILPDGDVVTKEAGARTPGPSGAAGASGGAGGLTSGGGEGGTVGREDTGSGATGTADTAGTVSGKDALVRAEDSAVAPVGSGGGDDSSLVAVTSGAIDATGKAIASGVVYGAEWIGSGISSAGSWLTSYIAPVQEGEEVKVDETTQSYLDTARTATSAAVTITAGLVTGIASLAHSVGSAVASVVADSALGKQLAGHVESETGRAVTTIAASSVVALSSVLDGLEVAAVSLLDTTATTTAGIVEHKYGAEAGAAARKGAEVGTNLAKAGVNLRRMGTRAIVHRTVTTVAADQLAIEAPRAPKPADAITD